MDVRAKQRLSYHVVFLTRSCVDSVSPHVNSIVRLLTKSENLGINVKAGFYEIQFPNNQHYYKPGLCSVELETKINLCLPESQVNKRLGTFLILDFRFWILDF